jgi:cold shock CspA family protein
MLLEQLFLTELNWRDRSATASRLTPYGGKGLFVHFSNIPKIGINYRLGIKDSFKQHRDPPGIYFYPVDWLLNSTSERLLRGQQYGVERPYFFIASINMDSAGLVLSTTTWGDVERLAQRNGWWSHVEEFRTQSPEDQKKALPYYSDPNHPGKFLWHFVERLERAGKTTWMKAFRGLTFIYDDNNSIIHINEPHQIVVLDPRIIRVVDMGRQHETIKPTEKSLKGQVKTPVGVSNDGKIGFEYWRRAITVLMNEIAKRYNGTVEWVQSDKAFGFYHRGREPQVVFSVGDRNFRFKFVGSNRNFWLHYSFGRAVGEHKILLSNYEISDADRRNGVTEPDLENLSVDDIIAAMDTKVQIVMAMESDLTFPVPLQEDEAKSFIQNRILDGSDVRWKKTEIENDSKDLSYCAMTVLGSVSKDEVSINPYSRIYGISDEFPHGRVYFSAYISAFGHKVLHLSPPGQVNVPGNDLDHLLDLLADRFVEAIDVVTRRISEHRGGDYRPKLYEDEIGPFMGWLASASNLSLDGRVAERMAAYINEFQASRDKDALLSRFRYVVKGNNF